MHLSLTPLNFSTPKDSLILKYRVTSDGQYALNWGVVETKSPAILRRIGHHRRLSSRNPECLPVMDLGVGEREFIAQAHVQGQPRGHLIRVLRVAVQRVAPDAARKIAPALEKEDRLSEKEAGERIWYHGKTREHKETVGGNALQHVELRMLVAASELEFVATVHPTHRARIVKGILIRVARPGNRISDRGVAVDLDKRRPDGEVQARLVTKTQAGRRCVVGPLPIEKFIPQI